MLQKYLIWFATNEHERWMCIRWPQQSFQNNILSCLSVGHKWLQAQWREFFTFSSAFLVVYKEPSCLPQPALQAQSLPQETSHWKNAAPAWSIEIKGLSL